MTPARYPYVLAVDADTFIERDALFRICAGRHALGRDAAQGSAAAQSWGSRDDVMMLAMTLFAALASFVARSDLSASWYQPLGNGWETVPSVRIMSFAERIPIIGLGLGRYTGLRYVAARASDATERGEHGITATGQIRRYAADASSNFVDLTVSHGSDVVVLGSSAAGLRATSSVAARGGAVYSPPLSDGDAAAPVVVRLFPFIRIL